MKEAVKSNMPRMQSVYLNEVKAKMTEEFGYKNQMEIPKMQKIAVNVGMGESLTNKNAIESIFKVKVSKVNTSILRGKGKTFKGQYGFRKDTKRAIVTLNEGNTIDSSLEIK